MAIPVTCRCGQAFAAQPHLAGKQVACPACGQALLIPQTPPAAGEIVVHCRCGRSFQAPPQLAGQRVACPACSQPLAVPQPGAAGSAGRASAGPVPQPAAWDPIVTASLAPTPGTRSLPRPAYQHPRPVQREFNARPFVIGGVIVTALLVLFGIGLVVRNTIADVLARIGGPQTARQDYAEARRNFQTVLQRHGPSPQDFQPLGSPFGASRLSYQSGGLTLTAYISPPPADGVKHPAVLFLHGGFAFGDDDWEMARPYRDAGFVVLAPVLRGENGQPGDFTLFFEEVNDVLAAAEALSQVSYVDVQHMFVAGHSAGGTLAALAAMAGGPVPGGRAAVRLHGSAIEHGHRALQHAPQRRISDSFATGIRRQFPMPGTALLRHSGMGARAGDGADGPAGEVRWFGCTGGQGSGRPLRGRRTCDPREHRLLPTAPAGPRTVAVGSGRPVACAAIRWHRPLTDLPERRTRGLNRGRSPCRPSPPDLGTCCRRCPPCRRPCRSGRCRPRLDSAACQRPARSWCSSCGATRGRGIK